MRKVWFIDSNILAHWIMGKGGVLEQLVSDNKLSIEFLEVYRTRYKSSTLFIDLLLTGNLGNDENEIFLSSLAMNELFSAVRDEVQSVYLLKNGVPLSRWRDPRQKVMIDIETCKKVYEQTLISFDQLFSNSSISIIVEKTAEDDKQYFDILSSLLFLCKDTHTQDVTLLTTAILNKADIFVTEDSRLRKSVQKTLRDEYNLDVISVKNGIQRLRHR